MSVDKKRVVKDIQFCKELMDRIVEDSEEYEKNPSWGDKHTVLQADIIRLRRELNEIRKNIVICNRWGVKE